MPDVESQTIIAVQAERVNNGKNHDFVRFYISCRALDASLELKVTCSHWSVENLLYWMLGIVFDEDRQKNRVGYAGENLGVIRLWILNILKRNTVRSLSMARKRKLCCLNDDY
ncbi:hypothetical protein LY04_01255 [Oceanimonas baumannii]|uniref:Uncharacterized protein n=1 Tax=Oceanimonas baumannii TaxID=129578 RepID=A0ABY2F1G9_9GAMM|nr:hypothetical protein LY04_01255 [Oceanimonas baumannii]